MSEDLVSIIIPTYNSENHIERAIKSVLNQTYNNIELVVVNDGSTDDTRDIVLKMKEVDNRIKYYENTNSGVSVARNIGLENATGKYIGFVDADDYIESNMIDLLVNKAEEYSCDLVSCSYQRVFSDRVVPEKTKISAGYYDKSNFVEIIYPSLFGTEYLEPILPLNIVTKLFKREIIVKKSLRFESNLKFGEDLFFTQKFLLNSNSFYFLPDKKLYNYTYNDLSATSKYHKNKWDNLKMGITKRKKYIEKYPQYELKNQISYAIISSSINAIINAGRNVDANKRERINELAYIIRDNDVQKALHIVNFNKFNFKTKIIFMLMKSKKLNLIYIIQKYFKKLK